MTVRSTCIQIGVIARKAADKYNQFGRLIFGPKVLLAYLFVVNLFIYFDRGVVSGILRALELKWGLSQTEQGALGSAFMVGYMIFGPIFAQLASRIPMKIVIFIGLVIWSVLTVLCGFTSVVSSKAGFYLLAVCRCLVGVGEAAYAPVAPTLLDDVAPIKSRTMYMSIFYLAMPVGVALGYGVSGVVADYLDWSLVFMGEGILIIPLAFLILMVPPSDQYRKDRIEKEDRERLVNENNSLLENNDSNNEISHNASESNIVTESDAMSQFGDIEKEKTYNIFQAVFYLFTNSVYVYALLGYTMYTFVIGALAFWGPTLVSKGLGIKMSVASLAFSGISVVTGILGSISGGLVLDRIGGSKGMAGSARGLMLCAIFIFLAIPFGYGAFSTNIIPLYFCLLVIAEFFIFCITSPVNVAFLSVVSPNLRNYSMSIQIFAIHAIGDFPSPSAMGAFADYLGGNTGLSRSILFLWTVLIFSVTFFFVGFLIARSKSKIEERGEAFADLKKENYQRAKTDL